MEETLRVLRIIVCLKVSRLSIQRIRSYFKLAAQGAKRRPSGSAFLKGSAKQCAGRCAICRKHSICWNTNACIVKKRISRLPPRESFCK